jgi:hypothetical protein
VRDAFRGWKAIESEKQRAQENEVKVELRKTTSVMAHKSLQKTQFFRMLRDSFVFPDFSETF